MKISSLPPFLILSLCLTLPYLNYLLPRCSKTSNNFSLIIRTRQKKKRTDPPLATKRGNAETIRCLDKDLTLSIFDCVVQTQKTDSFTHRITTDNEDNQPIMPIGDSKTKEFRSVNCAVLSFSSPIERNVVRGRADLSVWDSGGGTVGMGERREFEITDTREQCTASSFHAFLPPFLRPNFGFCCLACRIQITAHSMYLLHRLNYLF